MKHVDRYIRKEKLLWNEIDTKIPVIFWGCGNNAHIVRKLLAMKGIEPVAYCDNSPKRVGTQIDGIEVLSYEQIRKKYQTYYLILTVSVRNAVSIMAQLEKADEKNKIFHLEKPFKVDDELLEYEYLEQNIQKFETVYDMLEDELSKKIYVENVNFRLSGNKLELIKYIDGDSFFDEKLIPGSEHHSYVDVGAYTGDTLLRFYAFCSGKYDRMYAVEPDKENFSGLKSLVKLGRLENVTLFNVGGWDSKDVLTFYTANNKNERNFDSPNFFKDMGETVPSYCGIEEEDFVEEKIEVDTVDNLLEGEGCSVIKINALAADFQSLRGCRKTIERYKPVIVGEFGTRKENLTEMLEFMKEVNPSYKIYLRQKSIFGDCKTVFTAVDKNKEVIQ